MGGLFQNISFADGNMNAVSGITYDADAQLFITATGISGTNANAINQLVVDLKAASIWTKMKALYPMVGGTSFTCKWNLKNPVDSNAAFRLLFSGGGTFSSNGYQPNGTNAYADTSIIPSTMITINNQHLSYYSRTSAMQSGTNYDMGSYNGGGTNVFALSISLGGTGAVSFINSTNAGSFPSLTHSNASGFWLGNRTSSTANTHKLWKNGVNVGSTPSSTAGSLLSNTIWLGALPNPPLPGYFGNRECAFASIGDGLSDAEASAFYTAVQAFNTTLGRQV